MVLKMHHILPKCILFFKKILRGLYPRTPFKMIGEEDRRKKGKKGSGWESGQEVKGRRAGKRKCREGWEGRCVPPLFLKPIAAPDWVTYAFETRGDYC
jgi:hypothetical protein